MNATRLQDALNNLRDAVREVHAALDDMRTEHDPLAVPYLRLATQLPEDRKRSGMSARLSWDSRVLSAVGAAWE